MHAFFYIFDLQNAVYRCKLSAKFELPVVERIEDENLSFGSDTVLVHVPPIDLSRGLRELTLSMRFKRRVIRHLRSLNKVLVIKATPTTDVVDYAWYDAFELRGERRIYPFFRLFFWRSKRAALLAWEKVEIDNLMSWLSTLGGAFSALGDSFGRCVSCGFLIRGLCEHSMHSIGWSFQADIAGKISIYQWKIGMRSGDPAVISRCKLYYSISLIQKGRLKAAKYLVLQEYERAKKEREIGGDERLYKMCHGIWLKLQYSYFMRKQKRLTEHWIRVIHCCVELLQFFTK